MEPEEEFKIVLPELVRVIENTLHFFFSIYLILSATLGSAVYSALTEMSTRNRKKKCFWGVKHG
jgi:hypothetical protein